MSDLFTSQDIIAITPEIILVVGMCIALIVPVLPPFRRSTRSSHAVMSIVALGSLAGAFAVTFSLLVGLFGLTVPEFHVMAGMLAVDRFSLTFKIILYAFSMLVVVLWLGVTRERVRAIDGPDYVTLILGAVLGMSLMSGAVNFLMIFLAIESASFPSYALAGFMKNTRRGSEAGLKYVLFGALASASMLFGLSYLYGSYGTLDVAAIARTAGESGMTIGLLLGLFGFLVGVGFKLSAVPVHFWCPDVFEGAPIEITTFLSVASKGAAITLLLRVLMSLGYYAQPDQAGGMIVGIGGAVGIFGLVTATWGNLTAYFQDNVKRLLAYSSIAHAGYMIMGCALLTSAVNMDTTSSREVLAALMFYVFVYAFMNLGAFTVAAAVARSTGSESLQEYSGLARRNPVLALTMGVFLMSLFGMPLTGGFLGKVFIGVRMWEHGFAWLVVGLVVNTVFSLYFYLKPVIYMVWKTADGRPAIQVPPLAVTLMIFAVFGVFATGVAPDQVTSWLKRDNMVINFSPAPVSTSGGDAALDNATANGALDER